MQTNSPSFFALIRRLISVFRADPRVYMGEYKQNQAAKPLRLGHHFAATDIASEGRDTYVSCSHIPFVACLRTLAGRSPPRALVVLS